MSKEEISILEPERLSAGGRIERGAEGERVKVRMDGAGAIKSGGRKRVKERERKKKRNIENRKNTKSQERRV